MSSQAGRRVDRLVGHLSQRSSLSSASSSLAPSPTSSSPSTPSPPYRCIKVTRHGRVGVITLDRPRALNALSDELMAEVGHAVRAFDATEDVGCVVLTGGGKAFAAGADIKEMVDKSYYEASTFDKIKPWEAVSSCRVPLIAAVNGYALGGGCEIAMMCDIIFASERARFGQPEITIGTIPGAGGTQRLTRAVGKSKAMEMCLSGSMITAAEAKACGLVSAVLPPDELLPHTLKVAAKIASHSKPVVALCKEAVNAAYETTLTQGVRTERRLFHSTFALGDRREGMKAFVEKRPPQFVHRD